MNKEYEAYLAQLEAEQQAAPAAELPRLHTFRPFPQGDGPPGWLKSLLPHAYIIPGDPVFLYEMRDYTASYDRQTLRRRLRWSLLGLPAGIVLWLLVQAVIRFGFQSDVVNYITFDLNWLIFGALLIVAVLYDVVSDGVVIFGTAFSTHHDPPVHRELVTLSGIDTEFVLRSKFAAGQIRQWRVLQTMLFLRTLAVTYALLNLLGLSLVYAGLNSGTYFAERLGSITGFTPPPAAEAMALVGMVCLCALLLIEPVWRMRALVAAGVAASERGATATTIYNMGALVSVWLVQITMLAFVLILTFVAVSSPFCLTALPVALVMVGGGGLYLLYDGLRLYWLNGAFRRMDTGL